MRICAKTGLALVSGPDSAYRVAKESYGPLNPQERGLLSDDRSTWYRFDTPGDSGYLHLDQRRIPLATPVRDRIKAWLEYREECWPNTANQHLFISRQSATEHRPVGYDWVTRRIGTTTQKVREDRILQELIATNGDLRRICDMFGLTIGGAQRYAAILGLTDLANG